MSMIRTASIRSALDHFEPEEAMDPAAQRRLRGALEQIDYTAYAASKAAVGKALGRIDSDRVQRVALAAAQARAAWAAAALEIAGRGGEPEVADIARLAHLRGAYAELTEAYEAIRRMVERGYIAYGAA